MYCPGCTENHRRPEMKKCGGCATFYCGSCLGDHSPCTSDEQGFPNPKAKVQPMKGLKHKKKREAERAKQEQ